MASTAERIVDWDQLYPGRFWKAGLLAPTERKVLTICGVSLEPLETRKGEQLKGVISFEGETLQLPLNKTNGICLREMFGRVPYKWVGKRFAIFASEWNGEPAIRIWGSPDIAEDMNVTIELPRRTFKMLMHAMGDEVSLRRAGQRAAKKVEDEPVSEPLGDRCQEILKMMATAKTDDEVTDIEADYATESFNPREARVLSKAFAKRRKQLQTESVIR